LLGRTPRDWLLAKKEFIDFDLQSRELQVVINGECPTPLLPSAHAYRFAGFGTHEIVIYYDLIRLLLNESYKRAREGKLTSIEDETERLEQIKSAWLEASNTDHHGKAPALIVEWERRRIPWAMSGKQSIIDEDCPVCRAMARISRHRCSGISMVARWTTSSSFHSSRPVKNGRPIAVAWKRSGRDLIAGRESAKGDDRQGSGSTRRRARAFSEVFSQS